MGEDDEEMERRAGTRLEQHIGMILQIMVVGLLGWSLTTSLGMSQDVAVLKVEVRGLQTSMNQGTTDRYRGADAARDFSAIRQEMLHLEKRISELESKRR